MCSRKGLFFLIFILGIFNAYGQVTIGSTEGPNAGALLDLKESSAQGANSMRGLGLPRVTLLSATVTNVLLGLSSTIDNAPKEYWDPEEHIGMLVYHTNPCTIDGIGTYVWDGKSWNKLELKNKLPKKVGILSQNLQKVSYGTEVQFRADPYYEGNTYNWKVVSGTTPSLPTGTLVVTGEGSTFLFTSPYSGTYKITLTVTSNQCPDYEETATVDMTVIP